MATEPFHLVSPDEYLRLERAATYKSEYRDGRIHAMSGASLVHAQIATNLGFEMESQLRSSSSPCRIFSSDLRVHIPSTGLYTYPDLVALCQDPKFIDSELDTLLNPVLIVEILSRSTQQYDRGGKFADYRSVLSLTEYLTVAQNEVHIEQWNLAQGHWTLSEYRDPDATLTLESLSVQLSVRRIYARTNLL